MLFGPTALGPKQNKPMAHFVTKNNINKAQVNFSFKKNNLEFYFVLASFISQ